MKKKGLIIATIVMVLVLAVSLTTATYAWFATTSSASISTISIATTNASNVLIGLDNDNTYSASSTNDSFSSGDIEWSGSNWLTTPNGLGTYISTGMELDSLTAAVGTVAGTLSEGKINATSVDNAWNTATGHYIVKGNSDNDDDDGTLDISEALDPAAPNVDYIDWIIGFLPQKTSVNYITLNITVNPTGDKTTLGLLSALHLRFSWDNTTFNEIDLYGTDWHQSQPLGTITNTVTGITTPNGTVGTIPFVTAATINTTAANPLSTFVGGSDATTMNKGAINYAITLGYPSGTTSLGTSNIYQLQLQMYYAGYDSDCVTAGTGAKAQIYFTITNGEAGVAA